MQGSRTLGSQGEEREKTTRARQKSPCVPACPVLKTCLICGGQRNHLELLTPAEADAGLDGELIGGLAGASQRRWVAMVLVTAKISGHWREPESDS